MVTKGHGPRGVSLIEKACAPFDEFLIDLVLYRRANGGVTPMRQGIPFCQCLSAINRLVTQRELGLI